MTTNKKKIVDGKYAGQLKRSAEGYSEPQTVRPNAPDPNFDKMYGEDNLEGILGNDEDDNKKGTPYGENAKFNFLPPGQHIELQKVSDVQRTADMKLRTLVNPAGYYPFKS